MKLMIRNLFNTHYDNDVITRIEMSDKFLKTNIQFEKQMVNVLVKILSLQTTYAVNLVLKTHQIHYYYNHIMRVTKLL